MNIIRDKDEVTINPSAKHIVINGDLESGHKFYGPFDNLEKANEFMNEYFPNFWASCNAFEVSNPPTKSENE